MVGDCKAVRRHTGRGSSASSLRPSTSNVKTALVVGGDNVLLGSSVRYHNTSDKCTACLNGVLSQWFVSQFGKIDGHI